MPNCVNELLMLKSVFKINNCLPRCNEYATVFGKGGTSCCEATVEGAVEGPSWGTKPYLKTRCRFVVNKFRTSNLIEDPYSKHKAVLCRSKIMIQISQKSIVN